jgi:MoaA/NifB/PqqE/SkfB family radical SAM enzyme
LLVEIPFINVDIEPTNRCNAHCYFCPRDQTPHQGLMSSEVFDQTLARAIEFRPLAQYHLGVDLKVNLCGLGEPLLNKRTPEFVRKIREAGFECSVSSNAALLDEARGRALLDAGLQGIEINVGEEGDEYDRIYGLPFAKTCDNVVRFAEMAGESCQVRVVLVNHRRDGQHIAKMTRFWRERGIRHFLPFNIMNRAGALFVDEMQYDAYRERELAETLLLARDSEPVCPVPFVFLFVGYDGQYYLCCSDWKKEAPLGSVFDESFTTIINRKLEHVTTRAPICRSCNHDPVNRLTEELHARTDGLAGAAPIDAFLDEIIDADRTVRSVAAALSTDAAAAPPLRRRIQVTAL